MTDNDIIKALEHCLYKDHGQSKCTKCEYVTGCKTWLMRNALDLINRQRAEIERKGRILESYALQYGTVADKDVLLKRAKAEAVKEFAKKTEKMITEIYNKHIFGNNDLEAEEKDAIINFSNDVTYRFGNLAKEMVGEQRKEDNGK